MTSLRLNCPGHNTGGTYIPGCGMVEPIIVRRKIYVAPGKHVVRPILVCRYCKTRLLPTPLEIAQTKGQVRS